MDIPIFYSGYLQLHVHTILIILLVLIFKYTITKEVILMLRKKMLSITLATTLLLATVLTGCGGKDTRSDNGLISDSSQVINVSSTQDILSLDTSKLADAASNTIAQETQEGLVRLENKKLVAAGAEKWEVSEDGLTWIFTLKDYSWSDGKKVKADDYVYAVRRLFEPEIGSPNAGIFYMIKGGEAYNTNKGKAEDIGVKAIDDKTLEFSLNQPTPYFLQLMNFPNLLPLRQDIVEKGGDAYGTDCKQVLYSGPFVVDEWVKGSKVVLKKNDKYWDAGSVKLETANILLVPEEATRQQMFYGKSLDVIQNVRQEYSDKLKDKVESGEITALIGNYPRVGYIAFNNEDPNNIFTNEKVRLAFSLSLDRDGYVKNVVKKDQPSYGLVPYGLNNGDKVFREEVEEPLKEIKDQDPKKLLKQGLEELGLDPNEQIEITFLQQNANADTRVIGEFYQSQWQENLNVKVNIDTASDSATFNNMIMKGTYQVAQTGWGADYNDPMTFMGLFVSGDGNNSAFFSDSKYDELVKEASVESDMEKRLNMFKEAEKILIADKAGIAPLTFNATNYLQGYVKGLNIEAGGPAYELKHVYIENK